MIRQIKGKKNLEVVIIGGGLAGLAAADRLLGSAKVTILERLPFLGGLASSYEHDGKMIPKYYHHIISHNEVTKSYLERYGLLDSCTWKKISVAIGVDGIYSDITKIFGLLRFRYLNLYEKLRFGLFGLYVIFMMDPSKIPDDMDSKSWLYRFAGKAVSDKIFYHLYAKNKFNTELDKISAKQFANRLKEREVYDDFTYPKKGLQAMIDGLEKDIKSKKGTIIRSAKIKSIDVDKKIIKYVTRGQSGLSNIMKADVIINTIPVPEFIKLSNLPEDYRNELKRVRYCPAVCVAFGTEEFLDPKIYWFNIFKEDVQVIIQHSVLADVYGDRINWALRYGGSDKDIGLDDETIKKRYLKTIKRYFPKTKIKWSFVFRERYAEPIYDNEYQDYMPKYETPVDGLYMAGIQVTYPKIRNMNSALESGVEVAERILR